MGSSSSPGARVPVQVQDDGVAGSQGILVPHLVLPLGILPPDGGDSVPRDRSRGAARLGDGNCGRNNCGAQVTTKQRAGGWGGWGGKLSP